MKEYKSTLGELDFKLQEINVSGIMHMKFSRKGNISVARNIHKFENELEDYNKQKKELIEKYTDGNSSINPQHEHWNDFKKEFDELSAVDVVVNINEIDIEDLPEDATPSVCTTLEFMLKDDTTEATE